LLPVNHCEERIVLILVNAFKSITRSKGRNLLIGIIVVVIAAAACVGLAIRDSAAAAEEAALDAITITGTIGRNTQKIMESVQDPDQAEEGGRPSMEGFQDLFAQYPDLTLDQLQAYAQSDQVAGFRYTASTWLDTTGDIEPYSTESTEESTNDQETDPTAGPGGPFTSGGQVGNRPFSFQGRSLGDLTVTGYGSEEAMTGFLNGTQRITTGTMIDLTVADNTCLVSTDFAWFNGLAVGDDLTLANPAATDETYTCAIAGLFETDEATAASGQGLMPAMTAQASANQVYVSYPTLAAIIEQSAAAATTTTNDQGQSQSTALTPQIATTYVFASPEAYEAFDAELRAGGLSDFYALTSSDLNSYEASTVPLHNLSTFAGTLLLIVLGVGAVVLVAITFFNIRERKYEVGVLTAIGIPKPKVALQFATEVLAVTFIGVILGLGVGAAAAVPVANRLLSSQVDQQEAQTATQNENFGRPGIVVGSGPGSGSGGGGAISIGRFGSADVTYIDQINATVDLGVVGQLGAIGLGLAVVASGAGVIVVMRYEPLTILANRA
jgi:putative ABC transport system permease protein